VHRFSTGDRVVVIANPVTRINARTVAAILTESVPPGVRLDLQWTPAPGSARYLAERAVKNADGIVAVGGDGTVSDVASAMVGTGIPLGVLPGGSTNIVAREHGIPNDLKRATEVIFGSHMLSVIDAATCNDRPFLHMAGAGFDSLIFELADADLKRKVGWMAYLPAAAKALTVPPAVFTIVADGETIETRSPMVLVANGASIITPELKLSPTIRGDDGWLDLIVVTATKPHELASVIGRLATLRFDTSPWVIHRRVRDVMISTSREMPMQIDGDVVEQTPARVTIIPQAINLIVPREG
jgi:YegS/Rv2252/BmrU family lipid kinase